MYPPPHMTCTYPPPHMTCMYPPPLGSRFSRTYKILKSTWFIDLHSKCTRALTFPPPHFFVFWQSTPPATASDEFATLMAAPSDEPLLGEHIKNTFCPPLSCTQSDTQSQPQKSPVQTRASEVTKVFLVFTKRTFYTANVLGHLLLRCFFA